MTVNWNQVQFVIFSPSPFFLCLPELRSIHCEFSGTFQFRILVEFFEGDEVLLTATVEKTTVEDVGKAIFLGKLKETRAAFHFAVKNEKQNQI
jgi:hypothetical protein